ncbi:TatD family hydrolase [Alkaliflexus imshenetskii]|uniref:TatD family hydrolase n=1 Tax=Alkaliflexus imshenetskii TaxID=286730 RepID=UPI00047E24A5|nr:TatD family hydrolase [Alkaliflexus imshenetskii]
MIDTHSHIYLDAFDADRSEIIKNALDCGIQKVLLPNIDSSSIDAMLATEAEFPNICHAMMGLHPTSVNHSYKDELAIVEKHLEKRPFCGIGEIGMDLYWDKTHLNEQKEALAIQLKWAAEMNLPVVIHTREAFKEIFDVFHKVYDPRLKGVFHSFSGTTDDARHILQMPGFYLGINGTVTYKKSTLPDVLRAVGYEKLLLETDAPYLPPVPFRGKRNEPAYMVNTRNRLAEIFNVTPQVIEEATVENAKQLFNLKQLKYQSVTK